MSETVILIDALTSELRIARVHGGVLVDIQIIRPDPSPKAGDIIWGRVKAVVPGIRGAFLDVGDRRPAGDDVDGFLAFADKDTKPPVNQGEAVMVQVRNEAMADKGARLTTNIALTGRYAVYTPGRGGINISRKGSDPELAARFQEIARQICAPDDGVIVRTAALQAGEGALAAFEVEIQDLRDQWAGVVARQDQMKPPSVLLAAPDGIAATLLAVDSADTARVVVEGAEAWVRIQKKAAPELISILCQHKGPATLFEAHGIESQLDAALDPHVALPSGGRLHLAVTPACVAVDVDSAQASKGGNRRDVIRLCNLEAASALARELRLRNLAGNIIVDFISSKDRGDGEALLKLLSDETADDPVPVEIKGFSRLGFVEMVRRRRAGSLSDVMCVGGHKSVETIAYASLREAHTEGRSAPGRSVTVRAHPAVIAALKEAKLARDVVAAEETLGRPLILVADEAMGLDALDVYAES